MDYTEIIAEGGKETLLVIAERITSFHKIEIIRTPDDGMVMVRHIDPLYKTPFYMGEVYVTECEVVVDGFPGYSCVLGREGERALYGAVIDAVLASSLDIKKEVEIMLNAEEQVILSRWEKEEKMIAGTKVDFEVR